MAPHDNTGHIARMEENLNKLEHELQCRYSDMGKGLLEAAGQEQREINRLVDEIIIARKKLTQAKHEIQCETCTTFSPPDSTYCRRCGARLPATADKKGE